MSAEPTERDREIAALHEALMAKAREELEIGENQRRVLEGADLAELDQQLTEAVTRAKVIGRCYEELMKSGMDDEEAAWIARLEAERIREGE